MTRKSLGLKFTLKVYHSRIHRRQCHRGSGVDRYSSPEITATQGQAGMQENNLLLTIWAEQGLRAQDAIILHEIQSLVL